MSAREFDPLRLDVERFANDGGQLQGHWPLGAMQRLVEACHSDAPPAAEDRVAWNAAGERRGQAGAETHAWLQMKLVTQVRLTCQRCLGPLETPLIVARGFRFVAGEAYAAQLDADSEEDVLASTRSLDLQQLAEDELLLALPLVPRHEVCPEPLLAPSTDAHGEETERPNPFAALAGLKREVH